MYELKSYLSPIPDKEIDNETLIFMGEQCATTQKLVDAYHELHEIKSMPTPEGVKELDLESLKLADLAAILVGVRQELDAAAAIKTAWQKAYDHLSIDVLPDRADEENVSSTNFKGIGRLQISSDIRCSVLAKNKDAVREKLEEQGHGSLISSTINSSSLKALVREMMKKESKDLVELEPLLSITPYSRATVVKT